MIKDIQNWVSLLKKPFSSSALKYLSVEVLKIQVIFKYNFELWFSS